MPAQQIRGGLTRASARIADGKQIADLGQAQPQPLRAADEQQTVYIGPSVAAMLTFGPLRDRQQAFALVVPDRVGSHPGPGRQLPDRQLSGDLIDAHDPNAKPWTVLQVQAPTSAPSGAIVSACAPHGVPGDERRFRDDRERAAGSGGLGPDLSPRARISAR